MHLFSSSLHSAKAMWSHISRCSLHLWCFVIGDKVQLRCSRSYRGAYHCLFKLLVCVSHDFFLLGKLFLFLLCFRGGLLNYAHDLSNLKGSLLFTITCRWESCCCFFWLLTHIDLRLNLALCILNCRSWYTWLYIRCPVILKHRLALLVSLEPLLGELLVVFRFLMAAIASLRTKQDLFTCLVLDLLYHKLICGDQFWYHHLETCNSVVSLGNRMTSVVWLISVCWRRHSLANLMPTAIIMLVIVDIIGHAVVTKHGHHRHRYHVRIIPQTVFFCRLLFNWLATIPLSALRRLLGQLRLIKIAWLESASSVIDLIWLPYAILYSLHSSNVSRLVCCCNIDLRFCLIIRWIVQLEIGLR